MLTREDILKMEPGRELDAIVAEKVMGWKERVDFDYVDGLIARYVPNTMDVVSFKPSSDISAAWEVLEKMQAEQWDFTLENHKRLVHKRQYKATFGTVYYAMADSAPEAICKAALLAVMEGSE